MAKMKTEFVLEQMEGLETYDSLVKAKIIGQVPEDKPYVKFVFSGDDDLYIKDKDLELFAINILKALKSKRLK